MPQKYGSQDEKLNLNQFYSSIECIISNFLLFLWYIRSHPNPLITQCQVIWHVLCPTRDLYFPVLLFLHSDNHLIAQLFLAPRSKTFIHHCKNDQANKKTNALNY